MSQGLKIGLGLAASCLAAVLAVGCENNRELAPAAPSAITSGGVQSESAGSSSGLTSAARPSAKPDKPEQAKVALHGTLAADPTGSCPTVSFTLGGVKVQTTGATKYEHGTCADVKKDARINVQGTKGTDGVVTAKEIEVAGDDAEDDDDAEDGHHATEVELRGTIFQLNGVCPAVTFKLDRVQVKTSDKTAFDGARCTELKDGTQVKVKGVREGEGVVKASEVEAKRPEDGQHQHVELRGTVADLKGTCPAVSFHVGRPLVTTNDKTEYEGTRCQDLKNGDYVKVSGERTGDHSVLAKSVETERHDSRPSEVKGTISSLTGSCPKVSFKVGNTTVATSDRTQYRGLTCADLATWKKEIEVKGQVQADKTLLAAQITAPKQKGKD